LELARADVHVGDLPGAFRELEHFVRMGQFSELLETSPEFAAIREHPKFAEILDGMKKNRRPVSLGSAAFELLDSGLLAEDIDYDPHTKRFFITSVRHKKVVWVDGAGAGSDFAKAPDGWPMLAIKVDPAQGVLWATEVALQGFVFVPEPDWGRSALVCFDLKTGALLRRIEGPQGSNLGDMTVAGNGDVIVSDGEGGGVYRLPVRGGQLERLDAGDFISPQTPALDPDGNHIFVPDYVRGIGVLEVATKRVRWLSGNGKYALNGIDGMYYDRRRLIAVQNGTSPERVVAFTIDSGRTGIVSETIIEQGTDTIGDPTHGVVIGQDFYYIANSGWDAIDEHGNAKPDIKPSAPRVMRVRLSGIYQ
jgi:sugar lactone lactonase YvrE